jgi:cellulose synthase/poly-beta-1,6-N-acetylglucosamine synthase-like glycosyltransferase
LKVLSMYDCIHVTPGPFSIYRKTLLDEIGGFDTKNITEDHEIAFRIHKAGYKIRNCIEAKVYTILPDTFKKVYVQRRRWYSGSILTLKKHKDVMFNRKLGMFGYFIPFNYFLIMMGLIVSICSIYLALSKTIEELIYFNYTNFNFLDYLFSHNFDLLTYGRINLLGASMLVATIVFMLVGIKWSRRKYNENVIGLLGYPFLYLLYQIYWIGAIFAVIKRKEIKWR